MTITVLVVALSLGGNGSLLCDLTIELLSVALLTLLIATPGGPHFARSGKLLFCLITIIPLIQLIPLPLAMWRALPGHELAYQIYLRSGSVNDYHAISIEPQATRRWMLGLLPGGALFLSVLRASAQEARRLLIIATMIVLVSAIMGVIQFSTGALYPYATPHEGSSVGIFVNRNHHSDYLMAGMLMIAAVGRSLYRERSFSRGTAMLLTALIAMLGLCVVTTTSRMGNAIMPFALLASVAILLVRRRQWSWWWLGTPIMLAAVFLFLALASPVAMATVHRFISGPEDVRYGFWSDTLMAIRQFWPLGSGLGTFVPVYATVENLDAVGGAFVNHAHNDYLEIVMECGVAGIVLLIGYLVMMIALATRAFHTLDWPLRAGGLGIVLVLSIHSLVDYPLRTFALSALFGVANAIFAAPMDSKRALNAKRPMQDSEPV